MLHRFRRPSISINTLMKCIPKLANVIENKLRKCLQIQLAIVFNGWTGQGMHDVSVFRTYLGDVPCAYKAELFLLELMDDE